MADREPSRRRAADEPATRSERSGAAVGKQTLTSSLQGTPPASAPPPRQNADVRPKDKTDLSKVFTDFLRDAGAADQARHGDPALARADDKTQDPTQLPQFGAHGTVAQSTQAADVKLGATAVTVTSAETRRKGIDAVAGAILDAKSEIEKRMLERNLARVGLLLQQAARTQQLASLDTAGLDPDLVAAKRVQLTHQVAAGEKDLAALDAEISAYDKLDRALAREKAALSSTDPEAVALRLALAEDDAFEGVETKRKRSFGFDALAGTLSRSVEAERTDIDGPVSRTRGLKKESNTTIGGGGIAHEQATTRKSAMTDADGNATSSEVTSSTTSKIKMGEDGSVGLGKERKLSGAIENSYGRSAGGVGLGGAVTVNIIEIPRGDETLYAVVVTINAGLALEASHKVERGGGGASLAAHAGAEAQLTQTHVLDAPGAKQYLAELDGVANGGKAAGGPREFGVLYKAMHGLGSADELLTSASATMGSPDAAKGMAVDDSIELTTKVGGGADASVGAGPLGASGGASGELYRSIKIARVAGKAGQDLVEVSVTFGDSSDIHGALTAAALGVTASIGRKAWGDSSEAVTFRLDAGEPDYADLYADITGTVSRERLIELRRSRRLAQHVLSYSSKIASGAEDTVTIAGVGGVADTNARARSSDRGMVDGELSVTESGSQSRSTAFSLGPLDLLRRSQTDAATFELGGGASMLDVSETTDDAQLGKLDPSLRDLFTADSPAKAAEKALLETRHQLEGFFLDPEDIERLVLKAKREPDAWANVAIVADRPGEATRAAAWETLRRQLIHPRLDPDPLIPIDVARDLALGTAVVDFMTAGDNAKGTDYVRVLLRNEAAIHGMDASDIATAYEFPPDVDAQAYKDVRRRCKGLALELAKHASDGEAGLDAGDGVIADLQLDLARVLKAVEDSYDFSSERSRMEMIAELRALAGEIPAARRDFARQCTGGEAVEPPGGGALADDKERVKQLEASLASSKLSENWLLDRLDRRARDFRGQERADEMQPLIDNLRDMYAFHIKLVKQVRSAYGAACIDASAWQVSASRRDERRALDIDAERFIALYKTFQGSIGLNISLLAGDDIDEVHARYARY